MRHPFFFGNHSHPASVHHLSKYNLSPGINNGFTSLLILLCFSLVGNSVYAQVDWEVGTKWTYNGINYDALPFKEVHEPIYYEITDTTEINGQFCYEVQTGGTSWFVYWQDSDVYFYNDQMDDFIHGYSFENDTSFTTAQWGYVNRQTLKVEYTVWVDTSYQELVDGRSLTVREYSYEYNDSLSVAIPSPRKVFENIGFDHHSMLPYDIAGVTIGTYAFGDIRCFENKGAVINFQDYPCDTIIGLTTSTRQTHALPLNVHPNPTNGTFYIDDVQQDDEVTAYDVNGRHLECRRVQNSIELADEYSGWVWIQLIRGGQMYGARLLMH